MLLLCCVQCTHSRRGGKGQLISSPSVDYNPHTLNTPTLQTDICNLQWMFLTIITSWGFYLLLPFVMVNFFSVRSTISLSQSKLKLDPTVPINFLFNFFYLLRARSFNRHKHLAFWVDRISLLVKIWEKKRWLNIRRTKLYWSQLSEQIEAFSTILFEWRNLSYCCSACI
jgi:hypothetical protein